MKTLEEINEELMEVENDLLDLKIKFGILKKRKLEKQIELLNEKLEIIKAI